MNRRTRQILAVAATLALVVVVAIFAVGNFTWQPATNATARVSALNADPIVLPAEILQQIETTVPSQEALAAIYEQVSPSVVNIQVVQQSMMSQFGMPNTPSQGQGTGWVWDTDGHIVTNNHVVENAQSILVFFSNGEWADAEIVATDPQADLAVIRVDTPSSITLTPIALAEDVPPVGYYTLALGSPFGLAGSMTQGIVSAIGRSFPVGDPLQGGSTYSLPDVIQTDAAINPGNSGGPLLNLNGEVIGVNFAIRSEVRANAGVGFAIPVSIVRRVVPALITDGAYAYPFLGLGGSTINPQIAEAEELAEGTFGVFVGNVDPSGPAGSAGLQAGDIITRIDDEPVHTFEDLIGYLITETSPGDEVAIQLLREGETQTLTVTLGERPTQPTAPIERITVGQAIDIAREAALAAGLMPEVESTSARLATQDGTAVWIVQLEGGGERLTVHVDADTGEVLDISESQ
ncbi:PDZ domain-containing protein [bacterium]|nr:PDZ domain-containing protein [bacterium]